MDTSKRQQPRLPSTRPSRIAIEEPFPVLDGGRYAVKRFVGEELTAGATLVRDGHDRIQAVLRHRGPGWEEWHEAPMALTVDDLWTGTFRVEEPGTWRWQILAFTDALATWQEELVRKLAADQRRELSSELAEGAALLDDLRARAEGADRGLVTAALQLVADSRVDEDVRCRAALEPALLEVSRCYPDRGGQAEGPTIELTVERERAGFGSWYELFPRSWGGFEGVRRQLPRLAELGFDVLYLPPIHPIGVARRKGRNDAPEAQPGDPGSPWAIGAAEGGHSAIHPELGTLAEFEALVEDAAAHGVEIALDFAVQCSADHPWLTEHPEWFKSRPDGTLKYAENPPKRYMDIYNFDFDCTEWRSLWEALRDAMLFWVERGVRIFRVDNPHTKPLAFWEWLIASVNEVAPDTVFLSEAFTRVAMMRALAKVGFSQSYTYFTWKNAAGELRDYMRELTAAPQADYLRPNFFLNTPDILTEYLQDGGPAAFRARLLLAATLSPAYGIYSGFENFEATPREPGSEEYLDSEKYEIHERALNGALLPMVKRLNRLRREHRALQRLRNVTFLPVENESLLAYAKRDGRELLIAVVNTDPHESQAGIVVIPEELGTMPAFEVRDLLDDGTYSWRLGRNYVRLDPQERVGHLMLVRGGEER